VKMNYDNDGESPHLHHHLSSAFLLFQSCPSPPITTKNQNCSHESLPKHGRERRIGITIFEMTPLNDGNLKLLFYFYPILIEA